MAMVIASWGRLQQAEHDVIALRDRRWAATMMMQTKGPSIAYGMGRSYGDACLNPNGAVWSTIGLDHFIHFDPQTGRVVCEAGVLLRDIQHLFVPHGWMLPVTPGTQFVTVGGAIANDVHGKNHHVQGSFADHVCQLTLLRTDGQVIKCSAQQQPDWFAATVGGVGLTGLILTAELQLRRVSGPWLQTETIAYDNLDTFFALADESEANWEYTVSWFDCLSKNGRGLFMRANHIDGVDKTLPKRSAVTMPTLPISLVNRVTLRLFNELYFRVGKWKKQKALVHYQPFFYPLDNVYQWNRMYGRKGFYQYQCVVPRANGQHAIQSVLSEIARAGSGSFLAVLKTFGSRVSHGMLSFPQKGVTLALDFPNHRQHTRRLFARLDAIVQEAGGRLYLAKDASMSADFFAAGYPKLTEFLTYRDRGISSAMSRRLMGY